MSASPAVAYLIPTLNGGEGLVSLLGALREQAGVDAQIVVADSGSTDGTPSIVRSQVDTFLVVPPGAFDHGGTRNRLAAATTAQVLVWLTQDVEIRDPGMTAKLIAPILAGRAAATYARQLPRDQAGAVERFNREWGYPATPRLRDQSAILVEGLRAFSFSDAAGAVAREAFTAAGGFPEPCPSNEDMLLVARLFRQGHRVAYVPEAEVIHSHPHTLAELFRRFRLMGRGLASGSQELGGISAWGSGGGLLRAQLSHFIRSGRWSAVISVISEAAAKGAGFYVGSRWDSV